MTEIEFSSEMTVKLVRSMAGDDMVVQAAQVSAKGENNPETVPERLINALLLGRHGSPFEHTAFTFFVEVPIFVVREWQRHRMSSFNEMSGRYTELPSKFYIPGNDRKIVNVGSKMKPDFVSYDEYATGAMLDADPVRFTNALARRMQNNSEDAWIRYQGMLEHKVANEVARMVLPVNIYSQMYWTVNARSLMNFLSLRVQSDDSLVRSYPQYEIDVAAQQVEDFFKQVMPLTHKAFVENGRVAP